VRPEIVGRLADLCVYVEQGKSGKAGSERPGCLRPMFSDVAAILSFSRKSLVQREMQRFERAVNLEPLCSRCRQSWNSGPEH
jgi:hypothetical protein